MTKKSPELLQHEMTTHAEALSASGTQFNETQREVSGEYVVVLEKIALYSAGIVSLSITFVGSLLGKEGKPLELLFLGFRIEYLLFAAWVLLLVSFVSGLFVRWYSARNVYWVDATDWLAKKQQYRATKIEYTESGLPLTIATGEDKASFIENERARLANEEMVHAKAMKDRRRDEWLRIALQNICFAAFGLGVTLLAIVLMVLIANTGSFSKSSDIHFRHFCLQRSFGDSSRIVGYPRVSRGSDFQGGVCE